MCNNDPYEVEPIGREFCLHHDVEMEGHDFLWASYLSVNPLLDYRDAF